MDKKPTKQVKASPVKTPKKQKTTKVPAPNKVEESIETNIAITMNLKPVAVGLVLVFLAVAGLYAMLYFYK